MHKRGITMPGHCTKLGMSFFIAIYHILSDGEIFKDLGSNYYNNFNKERKANSMVKKLKALGYDVTIAAATATA